MNKTVSYCFFLTILVISFSGNISADPQNIKFKALRDLYELEVEMLESSIDLTNESKDRNKTINLYENLVELFCFYENPSKSEMQSCKEYSKKLESIYPNSIYLKCLELKDLQKCSKLFNEQIVLSVSKFEELENDGVFKSGSNWDGNQRFIDLRLKLEQFDTKGNVEKLNKEIEEINQNLEIDKTTAVEAKRKLRDKYRAVIPNACSRSNIYYTKKEVNENDNFLNANKQKEIFDEDFEEVGDSLLGLEKIEKKEKRDFKRIKLLTNSCLAILKSAYKFDKSIPEVHCFLKSFILPECKVSIGTRYHISKKTGESF